MVEVNLEDKSETSTEKIGTVCRHYPVLLSRAKTNSCCCRHTAGRGGWGHLKTREEMEDVERGRQREQDELYRDDHEGGRRPDVPMGDRVQDDVSFAAFPSFSTFSVRVLTRGLIIEPSIPRRTRRLEC